MTFQSCIHLIFHLFNISLFVVAWILYYTYIVNINIRWDRDRLYLNCFFFYSYFKWKPIYNHKILFTIKLTGSLKKTKKSHNKRMENWRKQQKKSYCVEISRRISYSEYLYATHTTLFVQFALMLKLFFSLHFSRMHTVFLFWIGNI